MIRIPIKASRRYDVVIGLGAFEMLGSVTLKGGNACVVSDTNVAPLYLDTALSLLRDNGYNAFEYVFEAGEASKNGKTYYIMSYELKMKMVSRIIYVDCV